jgi:hypothetical protein
MNNRRQKTQPPPVRTSPESKLERTQHSNLNPTSKNARSRGIAIVSVLAITLAVLGLLTVVVGMNVRSARITASDTNATRLAQLSDGYSDVARIVIAKNFKDSALTATQWLNLISQDRGNTTPAITPTDAKITAIAGKHASTSDGLALRWEIKDISRSSEKAAWVQLAATAEDSAGRSQTTLRKVQFKQSDIFELAILTEKVDCMFCHLKVDGDVGSIGFFRPGWGSETIRDSNGNITTDGSGKDSGATSTITGDLYAGSTTSADGTGTTANGTEVSGSRTVNYTGSKLPKNSNGLTAFPGLDRAAARASATGTITGGSSIKGVADGSTWSNATSQTTITNKFDGNLVLVGTTANPITLNGDVYVSGDVVIKGVVTGRGAIYSGRNTYIAGNLTNKNTADKPGVGACLGVTDKDACAKKNILAGKDEVRISAGNNIIMGDFTESYNSSGRQNSQASDFIRSQFGLWNGSERYIKKGSSEELKKVGSTYYDQLGKEVASSDVKTTYGDPYDNLIAPGSTDSSGTFSPWMTQSQYKSILGTESLPNNTWRSNIKGDDFSGDASSKKTAIMTDLVNSGLPAGNDNDTQAIAEAIRDNTYPFKRKYSGTDKNGNTVNGTIYFDGGSIRVAVNEARDYKTETTAIDAFLYANSRIAGRMSQRGAYINGGMIAREIGVLAPGKNAGADWWMNGWYESSPGVWKEDLSKGLDWNTRRNYTNCDTSARPTDASADAAVSTKVDQWNSSVTWKSCDFAINYDYRLRNGGYGYNLFNGQTGTTQDWQLDPDGSKKVQP